MCLRVKSCCGFADLAKGCRIIAWIGIVFSVLGVINALMQFNLGNAFGSVVSAVISYFLLYGVNKRKPGFIMAYMVVDVINIVLSGLLFGSSLLLMHIFEGNKQEILDKLEETMHQKIDEDIVMCGLIALAVLSFISFILGIYFFIVVYSYYKQLQRELYNGEVLQPVGIEKGQSLYPDLAGTQTSKVY